MVWPSIVGGVAQPRVAQVHCFVKSPTAVNDALDDGEERTGEEEGVDSGSPKELHETKPTKQVRCAVGKKQPKSKPKPLPTTQPGKIPEVTYPASLGYVNDLDNGVSPCVASQYQASMTILIRALVF